MTWAGILASVGGMSCVVWISYAVLRFKHVRAQRILGTLEWIALTPVPFEGRGETKYLSESIADARGEWRKVQALFEESFADYLHLVWSASARDLYWANRFGAELHGLSQSLVGLSPMGDWSKEGSNRYNLIAEHVRDFTILAASVFKLSEVERRDQ